MDEVATQGRITTVRYDPRYSVVTGWDLGFGDATAIWCAQAVGGEIRILRYLEDRGRKLADYHSLLVETGLKISQDFLPHDAAAHELIAGRSREETLRSLGRPIKVLPPVRKDDQIEAVRNLIPRCVFDAEGCAEGIKHLRHFRIRPVARGGLKTEGREPLHDEHSHGADAFAQLAIGIRDPNRVKRAKNKPNTNWIV
jgi:phage terminase large subunit